MANINDSGCLYGEPKIIPKEIGEPAQHESIKRGNADGERKWEWPSEPRVGRMVDGIPNWVDRIKCLGNAVVPQQFYPFFKAMADIEEETT